MVMTIPTKPPAQNIHDSLMSFFTNLKTSRKTESCAICFDPGAIVPGVVEFARAIWDFSVSFLHPSESFGLWAYFSPIFLGTNFVHPCMVFNFEGFPLHKRALFKRWCHII